MTAAPSVDALDPIVQELLHATKRFFFPAARDQTPKQIRTTLSQYVDSIWSDIPSEPVAHIEDRTIPNGSHSVPIRLYTPTDPRAIVMYFHGGGYVAGSIDTHDRMTRRLANGTNSQVVSVDYRLAPEHPYPAGPDDCLAATAWVADQHPGIPLLVAGDSAGGTMAITVTLRARDLGTLPIAGQVLIYPAVDVTASTDSMQRYATGFGLTRADMQYYYDAYLPDMSVRIADPYADPHLRTDLRRLPPALITTAGFDPLSDEGATYASRLVRCGVPVTYLPEPTLVHGYLELAAAVPAAEQARERVVQAINVMLAGKAF